MEREIANLARKAVKELVTKKTKKVAITRKNIEKYSGVRKFRFGETEAEDMVGVVTGLAWTEVGGEILTIESVLLPGKGNIKITGKLGDVMQESVSAALSYVRSRSTRFGIKPTLFEKRDIHVHVPEGATPKDGPSAGVAMATSIVSILTGIPVRRDVAMTGEITLRGRVLPIGGLKEKLLAALRAGITTVDAPEPLKMRLLTRARGPFALHCYLADGCPGSRAIGHAVDPHACHLIPVPRPLITRLRLLPVRRLCLLIEVADLQGAVRKVPGIPGGWRVLLRHRHGEMTHERVPAVVTGCPLLNLLRRGKYKAEQSV
jgi:hypothetical protein